jgi:hypothetical protein
MPSIISRSRIPGIDYPVHFDGVIKVHKGESDVWGFPISWKAAQVCLPKMLYSGTHLTIDVGWNSVGDYF